MKKAKTAKRVAYWYQQGGGTYLGGGRYPSDTTYQRGTEVVEIRSTISRHFNLPDRVRYLSELARLSGIDKRSLKKYL